MGSEKRKSSSRGRLASSARTRRAGRLSKSNEAAISGYAVCVRNAGYAASLETRKLYPIVRDDFAARHALVRVIDESGEDYLYPRDYFLRVALPKPVERALQRIA